MPSYSKFIKEVISNKFKLDDNETVMATEEFSIIIQNRLVTKLKDSMSFSIPRAIRNTTIDRVLCDLGASVNLMPFSTDKRLDIYMRLRPLKCLYNWMLKTYLSVSSVLACTTLYLKTTNHFGAYKLFLETT